MRDPTSIGHIDLSSPRIPISSRAIERGRGAPNEPTYVLAGGRFISGGCRTFARERLCDSGPGPTEPFRAAAGCLANLRDHDARGGAGGRGGEPRLAADSIGQVRLSE